MHDRSNKAFNFILMVRLQSSRCAVSKSWVLTAHIPTSGRLGAAHVHDTVPFHSYRRTRRFSTVAVSREAVTKTVDRRCQERRLTPSEVVKAPSLASAARHCHNIWSYNPFDGRIESARIPLSLYEGVDSGKFVGYSVKGELYECRMSSRQVRATKLMPKWS